MCLLYGDYVLRNCGPISQPSTQHPAVGTPSTALLAGFLALVRTSCYSTQGSTAWNFGADYCHRVILKHISRTTKTAGTGAQHHCDMSLCPMTDDIAERIYALILPVHSHAHKQADEGVAEEAHSVHMIRAEKPSDGEMLLSQPVGQLPAHRPGNLPPRTQSKLFPNRILHSHSAVSARHPAQAHTPGSAVMDKLGASSDPVPED